MKSKSFTRMLLFVTLFMIIELLPSSAFEEQFQKPERIFDFAHHLYLKGDYYRALEEFQRYKDLQNSCSSLLKAEKYLISCYCRLNQFSLAHQSLENLPTACENWDKTSTAWFQLAQVFELEGDYKGATIAYEKGFGISSSGGPSLGASLHLAKVYILLRKYGKAREIISRLRSTDIDKKALRPLQIIVENEAKLHPKNPEIGMLLSALLPGSGHIYAGEFIHGFSSLIFNTGFIVATYFAFKNDSPVLGSFLGYLETDFYLGGIKTAAQDIRHHEARHYESQRHFLNEALPVTINFQAKKSHKAWVIMYHF